MDEEQILVDTLSPTHARAYIKVDVQQDDYGVAIDVLAPDGEGGTEPAQQVYVTFEKGKIVVYYYPDMATDEIVNVLSVKPAFEYIEDATPRRQY